LTDPSFDARGHIAPEILASRSDPWETWGDDDVTAHLRRCRHCRAVYAEFVRARAQFAVDPSADMPSADLLEIAMAIPSAGIPVAMPPRLRPRRRRLEPVLAALAAGLLFVIVWGRPWQRHGADPNREPYSAIATNIRWSSYGALLYDSTLMPLKRETRGPEAATDTGPDLESLQQRYADHPDSRETAYWLIAGLLATDRRRDAGPCLESAIERFPRDARFRNLAAILAYQLSKLPEAEAALGAALAIERRPEVLYNLAKVLEEQGRAAESKALRMEIMQRFPATAIDSLVRISADPS
jgi:hypothetical protein